MGENFDKKVLEWKSNIENSMDVRVSSLHRGRLFCMYALQGRCVYYNYFCAIHALVTVCIYACTCALCICMHDCYNIMLYMNVRMYVSQYVCMCV